MQKVLPTFERAPTKNPENQVNEHFKSLFRRIEMKQQTKPATFQQQQQQQQQL